MSRRRPATPTKPEPPQLDLFAAPACRPAAPMSPAAVAVRPRSISQAHPQLTRGSAYDGRQAVKQPTPDEPSPLQADPIRPRLVISVSEARQRYGLGRTTLYALLARGALQARKLGGRTLIDLAAADAYFAALPCYQPRSSTAS